MSLIAEAPAVKSRPTGLQVEVDDRRGAARVQKDLCAQVRLMGLNEAHTCNVEDISEGGLFVCVPYSYGMNVGQRCEIRFSPSHSSSVSPMEETCYATVVRTEVISSETGKRLAQGCDLTNLFSCKRHYISRSANPHLTLPESGLFASMNRKWRSFQCPA